MSTSESTRMLGRYELLKRIAKGGMGEIYLARSRGTAGFEKNCIIKTILPHLAEEEEFVTKFLDEGRIVVQLVHGNIVPVFDMGDEDGEVFIAMEYIPGRDLREVTKRLDAQNTRMPVDLALFIASEVCKGLDYAHRKTDESGDNLGIVHRDVSPSNVLISREGEVKLIDFGIARASNKMGKTVSGRIQGKFCYMSPEQASGGKVDGRSDIFSTGVVLYELLTGFRPFEGDSDLESLDLVRRCEFDPPSALNPNVPDEVDEIVARALAQDADERFQTMDKLQVALMQYLFTHGSSPTSFELAVFLSELFPEGLERTELRSARDSAPSGKPMSLDDALDFELGKLGLDETSGVDPHETTAISSGEVVGSPDKTRTRSAPAASSEPATAASEAVVPQPVAPVATETASQPRSSRGSLALAVVAAIALGGAGIYAMTASSKGKRTINSDPPGAQISVDGLLIPGAITPYTLKLDEGRHEVTLELEGYQEEKLGVEVEAGTTVDLPATKLKAVEAPAQPKMFSLNSDTPGVAYSVNGAVLASPFVTLNPGQVVTVTAAAEGCRSMSKDIRYDMGNEGFNLTLQCGVADTPDAGKPVEVAVVRTKPPRVRPPKIGEPKQELAEKGCLIMSIQNPFTAEWYLNGKALGRGKGHTPEVPAGKHEVRVVNEQAKVDHTQLVVVKPGKPCAKLILHGDRLK